MDSSSTERPKLHKIRSNSSSLNRRRRPSRTISKYGSIAEERNNYPNSNDNSHVDDEEYEEENNDNEDDQDDDDTDDNEGSRHKFDLLDEDGEFVSHRIRTRQHSSERMSLTSTEHELTLKDKQEAMNKQHPFGLPLWKPALYKKSRSVVRKANSALHSAPSSASEHFLNPGNLLWLILFGWWLALVVFIISLPFMSHAYGLMLRELSSYLLWPFGRYVERLVEITPSIMSDLQRENSVGQSSILIDDDDEYEECEEHNGLLERHPGGSNKHKRYNWFQAVYETIHLGPAACLYYMIFYTVIAPILLLVSTICWLCVVTVPMAKLNYILVRHLRRHPLSLRFHSKPSILTSSHHQPTVILLCTYQAFGWQYYKYTYNGINIMFINLIPLVFFVIFDDYVLKTHFPDSLITSPQAIFSLSLASVIPLSYFIGMGVSSVSAQSSMGLGAVINATFGSIIEIILYAVALMGGKSSLVEGSLIGSILAGVLLMPGFSMISGAVKRKEQKFNAKSAGVTSTMLIMAIIGALSPTLFYQFFGSFELHCTGCPDTADINGSIACSHCYYDQMNPSEDPVYQKSVKPFMWICAAILPSAYVIGLIFSLHTHADMVWKSQALKTHDPASTTVVHSERIYPVHIIHPAQHEVNEHTPLNSSPNTTTAQSVLIAINPDNSSHPSHNSAATATTATSNNPPLAFIHAKEPEEEEEEEAAAGHDSPNWTKLMSYSVLFGCTLLYSIIAEILVQTVDDVMENVAIDEKFLGLTLFALVPNITEFMNAISFALYGNIVLSMEIGSAYALQVCLLQIPAMVAFSLWYNWGKEEIKKFTFNLMFPRWDVISVIFSVFLLTYTYQEGKSNYFKGSILILSYFVLVAGFYYIPSLSSNTSNLIVSFIHGPSTIN